MVILFCVLFTQKICIYGIMYLHLREINSKLYMVMPTSFIIHLVVAALSGLIGILSSENGQR